MKKFYVYILCDRPYGSLYVGVTSDLVRRIFQHKTKACEGYTSRKNIQRLVHYDQFDCAEDAIAHEKKLKKWRRDWKFNLIARQNPHWADLYPYITS